MSAVLAAATLAKSGEAAKAGPIGLAVILLLCIACYFLFKSMSKHMREVRENFPNDLPPAPGTAKPDLAKPDFAKADLSKADLPRAELGKAETVRLTSDRPTPELDAARPNASDPAPDDSTT